MPTGHFCCSVSTGHLRHPSPTLMWVPLSNSSRVPLPTSGHVEISKPNPLSGFAPKQTKGSSAWRTIYIVLPFKTWTRLFVLHFALYFALMPLGKVWIRLFSPRPQLRIKSGADWAVVKSVSVKEYSEFELALLRFKIDILLVVGRFGKYVHPETIGHTLVALLPMRPVSSYHGASVCLMEGKSAIQLLFDWY